MAKYKVFVTDYEDLQAEYSGREHETYLEAVEEMKKAKIASAYYGTKLGFYIKEV